MRYRSLKLVEKEQSTVTYQITEAVGVANPSTDSEISQIYIDFDFRQ